jgi:hypothetical protein
MIDPVPVGYIELNQAVPRRADDISDREYQERMQQFREQMRRVRSLFQKGNEQSQNESEIEPANLNPDPASLFWAKREFAINDLYAALCDGSLLAMVRDPVSGEMFKLTTSDWRGAAFWRYIIIGGRVHAAACEDIERHDGRRVLIEEVAFDLWLKKQVRCRPQPAEEACGKWLEGLMRTSPERRPKPKAKLRDEAVRKFGVPGRKFDRIWDDKRKITGANWGDPGAPTKQPQ